MDLTPSDAMASAAKRGLELVKSGRGGGGLEAATSARARKIAAKEALTPAHVKRMNSFFSRHAVDRKPDWGKAGSETPGFVAWQLWGGDSGKAWASARSKSLNTGEVFMDEDTEGKQEFAELFFADPSPGKIEADDEGLIWKPMLQVGVWNIGPNGRPLKVVAGKSKDARQAIGMQDVVDAFDDGAVPHVTIPLSHEDKVDENTGYLRKLKIATRNGIKTLLGGHHFTDARVKGKVMEGSIANTSVGLEFDYQRKDDGKKYPIVLRHNALTNRPWLGRKLAPFGLSDDEGENYVVLCGEYARELNEEDEQVDLWDNALTFGEVRDAIAVQSKCTVVDIATDRVLMKDDTTAYVARFSVEDGDVVVEDREKWVERDVKLDENIFEEVVTTPENDKPTSTKVDTIDESQLKEPDPKTEEPIMADEDNKKDQKETPAPAPVNLAEHPDFLAQQSENARLKARLDQLAAKDRERSADDFVNELKDMGLTESAGYTGLLKLVKSIELSDEGETALLLSEDGNPAGRTVTTAGIVREVLRALKGTDGKLATQLSEQQTDPLKESQDTKPPTQVDKDVAQMSEDEKKEAADKWFEEAFPNAPKIKTNEGN